MKAFLSRLNGWPGCVALLVLLVVGYGLYHVYSDSEELASSISPGYKILKADDLQDVSRHDLLGADHVVLVSSASYLPRDVVIRWPDKEQVTIFSSVTPEAYEFWDEAVLAPFLEQNPETRFRIMNSLSGLGERIGVQNDPRKLQVEKSAASAGKAVLHGLQLILFLVVLLAALLYMQGKSMTDTLDKHEPKDIPDTLDDLVGMADIKRELLQLEEMIRHPELYSQYGVSKSFNVMMTGPAGVGKTVMAKCLAKRLDVPMYYASAASLETGYVGGGPRTLKKLYRKASKHKRAIIFLDEAEGILTDRSTRSRAQYENETSTTLLSLLDGVNSKKSANLIWIVASNFDEHKLSMDEAMLRRFQLKINFRLPNQGERREMLDRLISKRSKDKVSADIELDHLATITTGMSPAALETLISRASLMAIQEESLITQDILLRAFERIAVGLTDRATTHRLEAKRRVIAIHESGHFICQLHHAMKSARGDLEALSRDLSVIKISTESVSKLGALGFVLSKSDELPLDSRRELEEQIVELYGGVANEELILGESEATAGAHNDIDRATRILDLMFNQVGYYSNSKVNFTTLQRSGLEVGQQRLMEITERSDMLYVHTLRVLDGYRDLTHAMTAFIMERYVMTLSDIIPIVHAFYDAHPEILNRYKQGSSTV